MRLVLRLVLCLGLALLFCRRTGAVILYPEDDAAAGTIPRPAGNVVGQWSTNASCVAIRPNYVLTTRHQGGGVGTTVTFGGTQYVVAEEIPVGNADLRIARLTTPTGQPANLTDFVAVYNGDDSATGQVFTMGGFGRGRGTALTDPGNATYGYQWGPGANDTLRFGRNTIDGTDTVVPSQGQPFTSDVLRGDFDRRGPTAVPFEAMIAEFDSGSGWFVENGPGNWQVRGLSAVRRSQRAEYGTARQSGAVRVSPRRVDRRPRHVGSDPTRVIRRLHQRQRAGADRGDRACVRRDGAVASAVPHS